MARISWETQGRQEHGWFGHDKGPGREGPTARAQVGQAGGGPANVSAPATSRASGAAGGLATAENVEALARIIQSEAGGVENARAAVGWTVRNRTERNGTTRVTDEQRAYAHSARSTDETLRIARGILDGTIADPTNGATHFYSPTTMPKEHSSLKPGRDVRGGLEAVDGVRRNNKPVRNYRPSFANSRDFIQRPMPNVPEFLFKFFAPLRSGHVR